MFRLAALMVAVFGLFAARDICAGELDAVRESVTTPAPRSASSSTSNRECDDDDSDGFFSELFGPLFWHAVISPWSMPIILLEDDYTDLAGVAPQPYYDEPFALRYQTAGPGRCRKCLAGCSWITRRTSMG